MDDNQDAELLTEFVSESIEGLQSIEQDLLSLENEDGGNDSALVNRIFRAVHSIKGTGGYLGLESLVRLSHLAETLLEEVRNGQRKATPDVTDAILAAVDGLTCMLGMDDLGASYDCSEAMHKLNVALANNGSGEVDSLPVPSPDPSSRAKSSGETGASRFESQSDEVDASLIADFVSEGIKGLREIESDLLTLERGDDNDPEIVNRIFRVAHTIKGSASYLKLDHLVEVAHRAEALLELIRSGARKVDSLASDAILAAVDALRSMLDSDDLGRGYDFSNALSRLNTALESDGSSGSSHALSAEDIASIKKASSGRGFVFRFQLDMEKIHQAIDIKEGVVVGLSSIGKILHASMPLEQIDRCTLGICYLYIETVLDADLLCDHFNLAQDCVVRVDIAKLQPSGDATGRSLNTSAAEKKVERVEADKTPATIVRKQLSDTQLSPPPSAGNAAPPTVAAKPTAPGRPAVPVKSIPQDCEDGQGGIAKSAGKASPAVAEQTMRVPVTILHKLLELTGTMVMARNQLMNEFDFSASTAFRTLSQSISGVHETVIETRMQTTGSLFERYRRVVRDLSRQLGKEVALHIEGGDLELDRTILESFADPLTHLIRNSMDHALETPQEREAAGKNRQGNIFLRSYIHSGEIILAVEDDGRGINADRVCEKAVSKGILTQSAADGLTERDKIMLIFQPGFSTKDQATDVSGRGVGMDVVRNNIESVGGSIDVQTRIGAGTTFSAILPLAKALVSSSLTKALIVDIQSERFAIPETAVSEIIRYDEKARTNIVRVDGEFVYQLRDQLVALVDLRQALDMDADAGGKREGQFGTADENACLVVLQFRKHLFGAIVDNVLGIQEIIVRGTPKLLQNCTVFCGHTVLGTGRVAMILDINGLVKKLELEFTENVPKVRGPATATNKDTAAPTNKRATQKMVVFSYAESEYFAIPLELVAIVERISLDDLRMIGAREYVQIKSETISIMRLDKFLPISPYSDSRKDCCLIRPAAVSFPIGILTGPDVSVIEVDDNFESRLGDDKGIVGTFLHDNRLVMLLDVFSVFEKHSPDKLMMQEVKTGKARILVAEDSLFFRKLIAQYIQREEWSVEIVNDGLEAWEKLQSEPKRYNLVISDINMPRLDGFKLAERIREDRRFDMLPLVALTTLSDDHFREKGLNLGFDRYVVKIDKSQVRSTVAECLQIRRNPTKR